MPFGYAGPNPPLPVTPVGSFPPPVLNIFAAGISRFGDGLVGPADAKRLPENYDEKNALVYETLTLQALDGTYRRGDPRNVSTGCLTTCAPSVANGEHGLPVNFGKGRGNWSLRDFAFMKFEIETNLGPQGWQTIGMIP